MYGYVYYCLHAHYYELSRSVMDGYFIHLLVRLQTRDGMPHTQNDLVWLQTVLEIFIFMHQFQTACTSPSCGIITANASHHSNLMISLHSGKYVPFFVWKNTSSNTTGKVVMYPRMYDNLPQF